MLPRARVHREDDRIRGREALEPFDGCGQESGIVHERRPVERDEPVLAGLHSELFPRLLGARRVDVREDGVDHRVADEVRQLEVDPLPREVVERALGMDEEDAAQVVGEQPVVLLGHPVVVAAQAGFEVGDRDVELDRGERAGERRVHVAGDDDHVRAPLEQHLLDADERLRGLLAVRAGADAEEHVGLGQAELAEEDVGHLRVVVLAGVDERDLDSGLLERAMDGRRLHEVRARADHERDVSGARRHRGSVQSAGARLAGVLALKALFWLTLVALLWTHVLYPLGAAALARVRTRPCGRRASSRR